MRQQEAHETARLATQTLEKASEEVTTLSNDVFQLEAAVGSDPTCHTRENSLQHLRTGLETDVTDMESAGSLDGDLISGARSSMPQLFTQRSPGFSSNRKVWRCSIASAEESSPVTEASIFSRRQWESGVLITPSLSLSVATANVCTKATGKIKWRWRRTRAAELDDPFSAAGLLIVALQECRIPRDGIASASHCTMYKTSGHAQGLDGKQIWVVHRLAKVVTEAFPINPRLLCIKMCNDGRSRQSCILVSVRIAFVPFVQCCASCLLSLICIDANTNSWIRRVCQ